MASVLRRVILGRIAAQTLTFRSVSTSSFIPKGVNKVSTPSFITNDVNEVSTQLFIPKVFNEEEEEKMNNAHVSFWIDKTVDDKIETLDSDLKFVQGASHMIENLKKFKDFSWCVMFELHRILINYSRVLEKYPQADCLEVFRVRMRSRIQTRIGSNANNGDITKDQVISRVLDVIKLYPKFDQTRLYIPFLLMNQGHFDKDLGLDWEAWKEILRALEIEFMPETDSKLECIPEEIESCSVLVDYIYENIQALSSKGDPTDDQIYSLASVVIKVVDDLTNIATSCDHNTGSYKPFELLSLICGLAAFKTFPIRSKLRLISTVFDGIQNHPQVKKWKVYHIRIYITSMNKDDYKDDLTKNDIIRRALNVIKNNPIVVDCSKVKEESYFHMDLNLNEEEQIAVIYGLALEFKLNIPTDLESCKHAIDYIYNNRMRRLSLKEFDENVGFGLVF